MKKVLIITYYWPPSAGSGVQRWVKFSKYLPGFDWKPIVFTPENPDFNIKDETLLKDISSDLEIIKFPIWEPYQLQRTLMGKSKDFQSAEVLEKKRKSWLDYFSIWIRGNILVPDPRVFWVRPSVKFLIKLIQTQKIEVIITTGPPHSLHLIGQRLKQRTGVKWIADFRDPWTKWELMDTLHLTPFVKKIHQKYEAGVLEQADRVITISDTFKKDFERIQQRKVDVITNGFDPDDFKTALNVKRSDKFLISHIGTIDDLRNPRPFLNAIKELLEKIDSLNEQIEILFVGVVSKKLIAEVNGDLILSKIVKFNSYIPHNQVFDLYKKSSVLLLVLANSANAIGNIPGKLFEYMASETPIFALGETKGDAAAIINDSKAGVICDPNDTVGIKEEFKKLFQNYKNPKLESSESLKRYSRESLTEKLVGILNEIT